MDSSPRRRRAPDVRGDATNSTDGTLSRAEVSNFEARLQAALHYAKYFGWALIPLGPDKKQNFKLLPKDPSTGTVHWGPLAKNKAGVREIRRWFREDPNTMIGVIAGKASGGLVIVDFDTEPPPGLHVPLTPRVMTARGFHLYLRTNRPLKGYITEWGEVIGEDKYAVLPPSPSTALKDTLTMGLGEPYWIRTSDPLLKREMLCRLS